MLYTYPYRNTLYTNIYWYISIVVYINIFKFHCRNKLFTVLFIKLLDVFHILNLAICIM